VGRISKYVFSFITLAYVMVIWSGLSCCRKYCFRVRIDPGKVWKVMEFNVEIFTPLKSLENDHRYGKVWKNP